MIQAPALCDTLCNLEARYYNGGLIGRNAKESRILFVLHRSDSRAITNNDGYEAALHASQTGKILTDILDRSGLSWDDIYITNLFKCLLPNDRNPLKKEYETCTNILKCQLEMFSPNKLVAFGKPVFTYLFDAKNLGHDFDNTSQLRIITEGIETLVLPHPRTIWSMPKERREELYANISDYLWTKSSK